MPIEVGPEILKCKWSLISFIENQNVCVYVCAIAHTHTHTHTYTHASTYSFFAYQPLWVI